MLLKNLLSGRLRRFLDFVFVSGLHVVEQGTISDLAASRFIVEVVVRVDRLRANIAVHSRSEYTAMHLVGRDITIAYSYTCGTSSCCILPP